MSFARPSRCRSPLQWREHRDPPAASAGQVAERTPREAAGRQRHCDNCRSVRRQVCLNASSCHARARLRSTLRREFRDERDREASGVLPGYLPDDRSLVPLTALLSTTLALWLLVYLVASVADAHQDAGARRDASVTFIHDRPAVYSPVARDISAQVGHLIAWARLCRGAAEPATVSSSQGGAAARAVD